MPKKKLTPLNFTVPETFILESLAQEDEQEERLDGKLLADILKLHGKKPIYYYFRTQRELVEFANIYRESNYRYLHLSCHGSDQVVQYTFGSSSYADFARAFERKLHNRRLFVSGCNLGNRAFAQALFDVNGGMYSVTAPTKKVYFDQSVSFWSAFYYLMHAWDSSYMKKKRLTQVLDQTTTLFEMPLAHFYKDTGRNQVAEKQFDARRANFDRAATKEPVLAGESADDA